MTYFMIFLAFVFIPLLAILFWIWVYGSIALWFALFCWIEKRLVKSDPPYCHIDPRNHKAFYPMPDGSGWIGNTYFSKDQLARSVI